MRSLHYCSKRRLHRISVVVVVKQQETGSFVTRRVDDEGKDFEGDISRLIEFFKKGRLVENEIHAGCDDHDGFTGYRRKVKDI